MMTPDDVVFLFKTLQEKDPHPKTELFYTNPYTLLVAVVLSAQSTDKGVNRVTVDLFKRITTPGEMILLGMEDLKESIKSIGLYPTKAKNIIALSHLLIERHNSDVPRSREALEALPGVGRKTANVVLNVAFGEETFAVDTHIFRVCNRTKLAPGKTPLAVEQELIKIVPKDYRLHAHHWLILHGRYTCMARAPHCDKCAIRTVCAYHQEALRKGVFSF